VATFNQTRVGSKLKQLALAAALCASSVAHAGVLTFEGATSPFVFANDTITDGNYWMTALGGPDDAFAGMFINGADQADICFGAELKCPQNNTSTYYAALADSYIVFGLNSGRNFLFESFDASFIGTGSAALTRGLLVLQGFGQNGFALGGAVQLLLPSMTAGQYNFANYDLGAFSNTQFAAVRILGYACDSSGSCTRALNGSNFAIDNLETTDIPEPATLGLLGLGLLGMGALRRRKQAA
jgi:hypothetical protein